MLSSACVQNLFSSIQDSLGNAGRLGCLLVILILSLHVIWTSALPKPIPGIPHRSGATTSILGDLPAVLSDVSTTGQTWLHWAIKQTEKLDSPVIQIFMRPFGRPFVILADFCESHDILTRRTREFDRSYAAADLFGSLSPNHHIIERTNDVWKDHRRLLMDLMSPSFLRDVAGPRLYSHTMSLIDLWDFKHSIARERPFEAHNDIYRSVLDAVLGFAFGDDFPHSSTLPQTNLLKGLSSEMRKPFITGSGDEPLEFPEAALDNEIKATYTITSSVEQVHGSPWPKLKWFFLKSMPALASAVQTKNNFVKKQLRIAVERSEEQSWTGPVRSAAEHMVRRHKAMAEKDVYAPKFLSGTMIDEVYTHEDTLTSASIRS